LLTRTSLFLEGQGYYHTRIPLDGGGSIFQLLGWDNLPDIVPMLGWASSLLAGSPEPGRGELVDPSRGIYRFARLVDGRLDAFLALTRSGKWSLPDRTASELLLGAPFDEYAQHTLFNIGEASAAPATRSPTVCACFSVAQAAIEEAVIAKRLTSVAEIGAALSAGTNCGSCIPELKEILRHVHIPA
jgi:assimilatory nitrate reductase catalytic subunit